MRFLKLTEPSTTKVVARSLIIGRKMKIAKIIHMATRAPKSAGSFFAIELLVCANLVFDTVSPPSILRKTEEVRCYYYRVPLHIRPGNGSTLLLDYFFNPFFNESCPIVTLPLCLGFDQLHLRHIKGWVGNHNICSGGDVVD